MRRLLAVLLLLVAVPCAGQSAAPLSASAGTLAERTLNATQSGLYYLPTYPPVLTTVTATALATPGSITVTPVLTKVASITTVAGSALVDGDYLTIEYDAGLTVPIEFDLSPGDGTTGGRVPLLFTAGDSADLIRDNLILLLNAAVPAQLTASSGGAATVALVLDTPGAVGGTNSENVTDAGFAVTGFVNPTAATTVTYKLVAKLADGTTTEAGAASSTAASTATLSAANFLRLTWSAVTNAASYDIYRTVSPTSPATTGVIVTSTTALTVDDTGLAGGSETAPTINGTGRFVGNLTGTASGNPSGSGATGRLALWSGASSQTSEAGLTYSGGDLYVTNVYNATSLRALNLWFSNAVYGYDTTYRFSLGLNGMALRNSGVVSWDPTDAIATADLSLSRIGPGIAGVGTGAAGSTAGHLALAGVRGNMVKTVTDNTATDLASFAIADGQMLSGEIIYSCKSVKGTDLQVAVGRIRFAATREAAVYTTVVNVVGTELLAAAAGTLTCTVSIAGAAGAVTLTATCDTSQASPDGMTFQYRFDALDVGIAITGL